MRITIDIEILPDEGAPRFNLRISWDGSGAKEVIGADAETASLWLARALATIGEMAAFPGAAERTQ